MALVIKEWEASDKPNQSGNYVRIVGRESGLISFILSVVGVDPTTTLLIDQRNVRLEQGSLSGYKKQITPLKNLCTGYFAYSKPWKTALIVGGVAAFVLGSGKWYLALLGVAIGIAYYIFNKQLELALIPMSEPSVEIKFKPSFIEGKRIDEESGSRLIGIVDNLINGDLATNMYLRPPIESTPSPIATHSSVTFCPECGVKNEAGQERCSACGASLN